MSQPAISIDWRLRERRVRRATGWQTSGGVVVDVDSGHVLIVCNRRERQQGTSGWTWPKGRIDPGEGPVFAALREIVEESGVIAEPLTRIALIETRRALRHYYLLLKIDDGLPIHHETELVRWVSVTEAGHLLERKRDLHVLHAARRALKALGANAHTNPWLVERWCDDDTQAA